MAEHEWKIAKPAGLCCRCQATFTPGQAYYSVLIQQAVELQRQDYCAGCFQLQRPPEVYYFWKTTQPQPEAPVRRRLVVDVEYVLEFFKRLEGENASQRIAFRYILAWMLARKKVLAFDGRKNRGGVEWQVFRERCGGTTHDVLEPTLSADEVQALSAELGTLLGLPAGPAPAGATPGVAEPSPQASQPAEVPLSQTGEK